MSKFDMFYAAVDERDGGIYQDFDGCSFTTNSTVTTANRQVTFASAGSAGTIAAGQQLLYAATARIEALNDYPAGSTSMKFRVVPDTTTDPTGLALVDGFSWASGGTVVSDGATAVNLAIDLRNAPTGKYNYVLMGFAVLSSANVTSPRSMRLFTTDDLSYSNREPRAGYSQGKAMRPLDWREDGSFAAYEIDSPMSALMLAEFDSGKIHYVSMFYHSGLLTATRCAQPRIAALRYVPELSYNILGAAMDGSSTATYTTTNGTGVDQNYMLEADIEKMNPANYLFCGQSMSSDVTFDLSGMYLNGSEGLRVGKSEPATNALTTAETWGLTSITMQTGLSTQAAASATSINLSSFSSGVADATYYNRLFGAFYCPATAGFIDGAEDPFANFNGAVTGDWQDVGTALPVEVEKQQQVLMLAQSESLITTTDTGQTTFGTRIVWPYADGSNRGSWTKPNSWRYVHALPFQVGEVARGPQTIQAQVNTFASGNVTASLLHHNGYIAGALAQPEVEIGAERDTLVILDTEVTITDGWTEPITGVWTVVVESIPGIIDQITGVTHDGTALTKWDGEAGTFITDSGHYYSTLAPSTGLVTVAITPVSGALDPDDPLTTISMVAPVRASILGSDVEMVDNDSNEVFPFDARIAKPISIKRTTRVGVSAGTVVLNNSDGEYDETFSRRSWTGRRARIYTGDPVVAKHIDDYTLVFDGEMTSINLDPDKFSISLTPPTLALESPLDLGDVTMYVGASDVNEYTQEAKLPVIYGNVRRAEAVRVRSAIGTSTEYSAMFGDDSFTPTKAYWNQSDPAITFYGTAGGNDADVSIRDVDTPLGTIAGRAAEIYLDGRGLDFDHAGEICLDIISRFSTLPSEKVNEDSFRRMDISAILKVDALGDRVRGDAAVVGFNFSAETTVREALEEVLGTVGGQLVVTADGRISAGFINYNHRNLMDVLPSEAESWCNFGALTTQVAAHPGFAGRRWATKFKVPAGPAQTASGEVVLTRPGNYAFEAMAVAGTFNNPNDLLVEILLPGDTTRTVLHSGAVPLDTGYPAANTWDWELISSTFTVQEFHTGTAIIYVTPRTAGSLEVDVYLDNTKLVPVTLVTDENAAVRSMVVIPRQYAQVASKFNVNPQRADVAPTAVATASSDSSLPADATDNRLTLPGGTEDAESSLGVASYSIAAVGNQYIEAIFAITSPFAVPVAGEYLHVDMDRVPNFNYPSKIWRITEVNQKAAAAADYEITAVRETISRYKIA